MSDREVVGPPRTHRLVCVECRGISGLRATGWRAYRVDDPDEDDEPELACYCPACSAREFGTSLSDQS